MVAWSWQEVAASMVTEAETAEAVAAAAEAVAAAAEAVAAAAGAAALAATAETAATAAAAEAAVEAAASTAAAIGLLSRPSTSNNLSWEFSPFFSQMTARVCGGGGGPFPAYRAQDRPRGERAHLRPINLNAQP